MVKPLPAMRETWAQSLGWEDHPEEGKATPSSILVWRIPMDRGTRWATVHEVAKESGTTEQRSTKYKIKSEKKTHTLITNLRMITVLLYRCCYNS